MVVSLDLEFLVKRYDKFNNKTKTNYQRKF